MTRNFTEGRISISICHGLTRKNTEKTEAETRKRQKKKYFRHGMKTNHSESEVIVIYRCKI